MTYEEQPGEIRQTVANLEEISADHAVILLEEEPNLGSPISLAVKDRDLFGVIKASLHDVVLGWYAIVGLDARSRWNRDWFTPEHLLELCASSWEGATRTKAQALESPQYTEENVPVTFVVSEA